MTLDSIQNLIFHNLIKIKYIQSNISGQCFIKKIFINQHSKYWNYFTCSILLLIDSSVYLHMDFNAKMMKTFNHTLIYIKYLKYLQVHSHLLQLISASFWLLGKSFVLEVLRIRPFQGYLMLSCVHNHKSETKNTLRIAPSAAVHSQWLAALQKEVISQLKSKSK